MIVKSNCSCGDQRNGQSSWLKFRSLVSQFFPGPLSRTCARHADWKNADVAKYTDPAHRTHFPPLRLMDLQRDNLCARGLPNLEELRHSGMHPSKDPAAYFASDGCSMAAVVGAQSKSADGIWWDSFVLNESFILFVRTWEIQLGFAQTKNPPKSRVSSLIICSYT